MHGRVVRVQLLPQQRGRFLSSSERNAELRADGQQPVLPTLALVRKPLLIENPPQPGGHIETQMAGQQRRHHGSSGRRLLRRWRRLGAPRSHGRVINARCRSVRATSTRDRYNVISQCTRPFLESIHDRLFLVRPLDAHRPHVLVHNDLCPYVRVSGVVLALHLPQHLLDRPSCKSWQPLAALLR